MIEERKETFMNFFTPVLVFGAGATLSTLAQILAFYTLPIVAPILFLDEIGQNLYVLSLSQIIGTVVVLFFLIPFFKVRDVEHQTLSIPNFFRTILVICFTFFFVFIFNLFVAYVVPLLDLPFEHSYESLIPEDSTLFSNPSTLFFYFFGLTIGAGVFEELLYRRMLIPLLEERGMAPFTAVLASTLVFAFIHVPNDLINGTLTYAVTHFLGVCLIGFAAGTVYILTRNIIYSMIVHAFMNSVSIISVFLSSTNNFALLSVFDLVILGIIGIGMCMIGYVVWTYLKNPTTGWFSLIKEQSSIKILPGLVGFLGMSIVVLISLIGLKIFRIILFLTNNIWVALIPLLGVYALFFGVFLFLKTQTIYEPSSETLPSFA
ncbi:MAG: lysostaphin resistance A-like protein [Candidatus Hermodarchaeota archaeon]